MKTIALIVFVCVPMSTAYGFEHKRLTYEQAEALALVAATIKGLPHPNTLTQEESGHSNKQVNSRKFINFEIFYPNSSGASLYTVSLQTGDVFISPGGLAEDCALFRNKHMKEIKTKKLNAIQERVRHAIRLPHDEYQRLRAKRPRCQDQYN